MRTSQSREGRSFCRSPALQCRDLASPYEKTPDFLVRTIPTLITTSGIANRNQRGVREYVIDFFGERGHGTGLVLFAIGE